MKVGGECEVIYNQDPLPWDRKLTECGRLAKRGCGKQDRTDVIPQRTRRR